MSTQLATTANTSVENRAKTLLGQGIPASVVAATCGVSESRISQLLSDEQFSAEVTELRFASLQEQNARDKKTDSLEDKLLQKFDDLLPLMTRPMEVARAFQIVNQAKRRGTSSADSTLQKQTVVQLTMPAQIIQRFQVNQQNHVIQAGDQTLLTLQSGSLLDKVKKGDINALSSPTTQELSTIDL